jgi:hypothetical protein
VTRISRTLVLGASALGAWLGGADLGAQELRGRVVDAGSEAPVAGAMVIASDAAGGALARTLTDDRGDFVLGVPPATTVRSYQVVRIGYAAELFPTTALSFAEAHVLRIASSPIELDGIGVVADNLCGLEFEGSGSVYDIWLEARKALEMTRLTQSNRSLSFDTEIIARVLDPQDLSERERTVVPRRLSGRTPYYSLSGEEMTRGWVAPSDDGGLMYWAPDATALLSSEFEDQHCFGAELGDSQIVLRFAPNRERREIPDISGEVTLDRATHGLERLRFEYTSLPLPREAEGRAGGEVHFAAAPNGSWVVTTWWIRMPVLVQTERVLGRSSALVTDVVELREEGGRLVRIRSGSEVIQVGGRPPA